MLAVLSRNFANTLNAKPLQTDSVTSLSQETPGLARFGLFHAIILNV